MYLDTLIGRLASCWVIIRQKSTRSIKTYNRVSHIHLRNHLRHLRYLLHLRNHRLITDFNIIQHHPYLFLFHPSSSWPVHQLIILQVTRSLRRRKLWLLLEQETAINCNRIWVLVRVIFLRLESRHLVPTSSVRSATTVTLSVTNTKTLLRHRTLLVARLSFLYPFQDPVDTLTHIQSWPAVRNPRARIDPTKEELLFCRKLSF